MRSLRFRALAAVLIAAILVVALPGQETWAGGNIGPRAMLNAYYSYINAGQYGVPYAQWTPPQQTYDQFAAGYATTLSVRSLFGGFQASGPNSLSGRMPAFLQGNHADHAELYAGCYEVRYNDDTTGIAQWTITGAQLDRMVYAAIDDAYLWEYTLDRVCYDAYRLDSGAVTPAAMLVNYFDAVNRGDYAEAYSYWSPPRQTYQQFVTGWANTTETVMFYGNYRPNPSYVYSLEAGRVPVVLLGYHTDGSMVAYQGCLAVTYNATISGGWGLYRAFLTQMLVATTPTDAAILAALNGTCY